MLNTCTYLLCNIPTRSYPFRETTCALQLAQPWKVWTYVVESARVPHKRLMETDRYI